MSEPSKKAARQVQQHLEALNAAGVEFVSAAGPLPPPPAAGEKPAAAPVVAGSLFAEVEAAQPEEPPEARRQALTVLAAQVAGCTRCDELAATRTQTVFGVGPLDPDIMFVGEAPGADEDRTGEPFVGAAGQLLNKIIAACGLKREDVYIMNGLRCRPPGNRQPKPDELANCREWFDKQFDLVRPRTIVALGATAAQHMLKTKTPIGKLRGKFHDYRGVPLLATYHPASLLPSRSPENKRLVWEDMKAVLRKLGRPVPGPGG